MENNPESEGQMFDIVKDPAELGLFPDENLHDQWIWQTSHGDRTLVGLLQQRDEISKQIASGEISHEEGMKKTQDLNKEITEWDRYIVNNKGNTDSRD